MELQQGTVKWFNDAKGFGFIKQDNGQDVFVHYSAIRSRGYKTAGEGEILLYEKQDRGKGPYARVAYRTRVLVPERTEEKSLFE